MSKCLYIFNLILIIPVTLCDINFPCDLTDSSCFNLTHKLLLKLLITGIPSLNVLSSDPLHQDQIRVTLPNMDMTLTDANMYGTQACDVDDVKLETNTWYFSMICPKLTLTSDYEMNGDVDSIHIEGRGKCEIIYDNYKVGMSGDYETNPGTDGKSYFNVLSYKMDLVDVQGGITYNFTNLFDGDNEKSMKMHQYLNSNWKKLHDIIGEPIIYNLIGYFVDNVNKFVKLVPISDIFNIPLFFKNIPSILSDTITSNIPLKTISNIPLKSFL